MNAWPRSLAVTVASAVLAAGAALAQGPTVRSERVGDLYRIEGSFAVGARPGAAWNVLSDYEHIPAFVSSIRESRVLERHGDRTVLEQEATGRALFIEKDVRWRLEVREKAGEQIAFEDVGRRDFVLYRGTWTVREDAAGTRVEYELVAKPRQEVPSFIGVHAFSDQAKALLDEVRTEILKRSKGDRT